ncbi:hypothetical protein OWR29_45285 [Actinoplanes sp. Pm04-4]|uniref:Uncharacterized protein n=1 Tax=Paractinoplanes pyxinae TaxID=2997416 RepID=A0ABT4BI45_9ACTN|nr:hypothetical protein [Actinoplanes pyxinae]MCY1145260.1 hypothetical protein [Actinoplanes pyxinae]
MLLLVPTPSPSLTPATESASSGTNATLIAVVGIVGTLLGVLITQWLTSRREREKWQLERDRDQERWDREAEREEKRWERERQERQEQWHREDAARLHQDRLALYSSLLAAGLAVRRQVVGCWLEMFQSHPPTIGDVNKKIAQSIGPKAIEFADILTQARIIGSPAVLQAAETFWKEVSELYAPPKGLLNPPRVTDVKEAVLNFGGRQEDLKAKLTALELTVRRDIGSDG